MLCNVNELLGFSILPPESGLSFVWYHSPWAQSVSSTPWSYNPAQTWTSPIPGSSFSGHKFSFPGECKKLQMLAHFKKIYSSYYQHFQWVHLIRRSKSAIYLTLSWMVSSLSTISLRSPWMSFFIFSFSPFSLDTSDLNLLISSLWSSISRCWLMNYKES